MIILSRFACLCFVMAISSQSIAWAITSERSTQIGAREHHIRTVIPPLAFDVDPRMRRNVEFWIRIYTEYTNRTGLIHDAKYIDKVYERIDLDEGEDSDSKDVRAAKKRWKDLLLAVHKKEKKPETLNEEERKLYKLFEDISEPNKFLNAAHRKRLRFQLGQKDSYLDGLKQSGRYLPLMEEIFKREGLPVELTRLPFVESSFNVRARSKVGASGIWQFMRSTGKLFLRINDAVDERNDPIRATEAAARLLKMNYESLGKWPLAVTAYNHGRKGMMRAVRQVGSEELEDLVGNYRSRSFGFASGNFFTELLAAIEVERDAEKYFGKVERDRPLSFYEVKIPDFVSISDLAEAIEMEPSELKGMNPGLTDLVWEESRLVPAGYQLRVPLKAVEGRSPAEATTQALEGFQAAYKLIPSERKRQGQMNPKYVNSSKSKKRMVTRAKREGA